MSTNKGNINQESSERNLTLNNKINSLNNNEKLENSKNKTNSFTKKIYVYF